MAVRARGTGWTADIAHRGKRWRKDFDTKNAAEVWFLENLARVKKGEMPEMGGSASTTRSAVPVGTLRHAKDAAHDRWWKLNRSVVPTLRLADEALAYFGESTPCADITTAQIDAWTDALRARGLSGSSINHRLAVISKMLRAAATKGWISSKPVIERATPAPGRVRWLTEAEEERLLAALLRHGWTAEARLTRFLIEEGCRIGEALSLVEGHFEARKRVTFWKTKNGKPRTVPLTKRALEYLPPFSGDKEASVFGLTYYGFESRFHKARKEAGPGDDVVIHTLRHTSCSRKVRDGMLLLAVKDWHGHSSLAVTERYAHLAPHMLENELSRLEQALLGTQEAAL
ncbi:DNA integration/recombination/inversion protein [Roseomonas mucosa]|jgi:integrase|uniref:tyrosine-type recombinase/integrase n=1 Tax=Roseomonas TaxID=125216 RepID=UPI00095EEE1E|nr:MULTISPECIES: site-specific integrase [Roseomonas]MDT8263955.1 tyrosine-type recombinase/integrase [Roseomonas sp. DSM 102946]ATR21707.1 site-specific integrase [Roseomonas sp. FDAARGOS_362]USQ70165.1 site-specific integrase [Roseomonas mucosa]UZO95869.1 DNA integration/recombination/inversion protein [Roseomonas mucosa]GAV35935.1 site-specific tyrosine recombinase XerC [Roseomonas sp. TAS13]